MPPTTDRVRFTLNGAEVSVRTGTTLAAALLQQGISRFRRSVSGEERGPLCGMGICMECRVLVDGVLHTLACQTLCRDSMVVETDE